MSIKKNNKMFNLDEGQKFKVRKSKKYKNLCSLALGVISVSGFATATVSADETVTPATSNPIVTEVVTSSTETPTETSVAVTPVAESEAPVESPVPSTNLTEVQPEPTVEATETQNVSDTQSGDIAVTNGSDSLNEAVAAAEQEGVVVKEEVAKDYGVTTSAEETAQKQAEIQADYAKQTETIKQVTADYVTEKEKHEVAANQVIAENTQLKAEYDAQILAYNQEVAKVNGENAAIDAAYEKARQAYEAEVANITASNADAKVQYEKALANYKSEVTRIQQENAQKKEAYEKELATYNQAVTQVNADNQKIEDDYQEAYKAYVAEVDQITATNADREVAYNKALATYKSEVERINQANEEKRVAYEKALAAHNSAIASVEAENKLIEQRNQAATSAYNKAMELYATEKAKYDQTVAEAKANTAKDGYASELLTKALVFESEPNATFTLKGNFGYVDSSAKWDITLATREASIKNFFANETTTPQGINNSTTPHKAQAVLLDPGEYVEVFYTNLQTSTYLGKPLSELYRKYTNSGTEKVVLFIERDPSIGMSVYTKGTQPTSVDVALKFKDQSGDYISASKERPFLLALSSLNSGVNADGTQVSNSGEILDKEQIKNYNFRFVKISGSSVDEHADGIYSSTNNGDKTKGSKYAVPEWDNETSDLFYYGSGVGVLESGDTISFTSYNQRTTNVDYVHGQWLAISSKVATAGGIISTPPKKPTLALEDPKTNTSTTPATPTYEKLPEAPSVSYLETPEAPTKPTPKPLPEEPEVPTYDGLPEAPSVSYKETPEAPEKGSSVPLPPKPEEPTYKEIPEAPEAPTVSYRLATLTTQPQTSKEVETAEGVNVDKGLVAKGQTIVFELVIDALSANRSLTTSGTLSDSLPTGFELDLETTVNANSAYELTYAANSHNLTGNFTKDLVLAVNSDLVTSFTPPSLKVYGRVLNDAATYKNAWTFTLNGGDGKINGYTRTSNVTVIHTPGDPNDPDNPTNNEITPLKANTNASGVKIDGKVVPIGGTNYYTITLDYDQYNTVTPDKEVIAKGFGAFDDYPEEALQVDLSKATAIDSDGNAVSGLTLADNSSIATSAQTVQQLLSSSGIGDKIAGAFISVTADDPQAYYDAIIKTKKSVTITIPMVVKDSLYNTGKSYSNTAYQLDFGNGYKTNTVTNTTPVVTPTKVNTNAAGTIINGKYVLANSVNYYKVSLDYSQYKGIEADASLIAQGFFGVDDVPEEALTIENSGIQLIASDNSVVKGMTTNVYANLLEAPKALQEAMAKRGYTPKGVILVISADDPQAFYDTYVKAGMTITATLPMTVKADMAKTGGKYENTAYQVDFGSAYITETVVNNVPKLDPKKDVVIDLSHDTESLAGQDIELGTVFNYKLSGAELPADRGSEIYAYTWYDNYDEKHDQYDGVYKIFAAVAFETEDGTSYAAGTELTRFSIQTVNTVSGEVDLKLDEEFLRSVKDLSDFKADAYLQMKRIATGDVQNTYTHGVNDAKVEANTVTTHTPVGNVLVNFIEDGTGKVLKAQVVDEKEVATGTAYDTTDRKVTEIVTEDGKTYELVRTEGLEQGKVVKGDTVINYIYKEVLGDVTVAYKDKDGNVIKDPVVDTESGSTGRDYDTTDNKPTEIITTDGKTYQLVPKLTEGQETGKVGKGNTTITYVYEEVKADVLVNYVDEEGNVIKEQVKDVDQGSTGTDYDTTDNKPEYIEVDGVKYKLMPKKTVGEETGKLTKDGAEVTYVYHKIVTNWIEEGTNENLKPQEDGEQDRGSFDGYDYVTTEVDPETGDITHVFKTTPMPVTPTPVTPQPQATTPVAKAATLPATGEADSVVATTLGFVALTGATGLALKTRRKEDN